MKTVVIGGVPRSGKSLLAQSIHDSIKSSVTHLDMLCGCVRKAYPDSFKNHDDPDDIYGLIDDYQNFLIRVIKNIGHEFNYVRVFESTFISPIELSARLNNQKYITLFMGYPNIKVEQKQIQLRKYGENNPQCWSNQVPDRKLTEHLSHFIDVSKKQKQACKKYGILFFDTSSDFVNIRLTHS